MSNKLPKATVHGRFQPPVHLNHWNYIKTAFDSAHHVTILITNPYQNEAFETSASWRSDPAQNPFSYEERVFMFRSLLGHQGIASDRYSILPFNIKDPAAFRELDPEVPNFVNVYSEWSAKKLASFAEAGLTTIQLSQPKTVPVSGTSIRQLIFPYHRNVNEAKLRSTLTQAGFLPEALDGLIEVLNRRAQKEQAT